MFRGLRGRCSILPNKRKGEGGPFMIGSEWSLSLGCWGGVHVRLHVSLPIVILCALLWGGLAQNRFAPLPVRPSMAAANQVAANQAATPERAMPMDRVLVIIFVGLLAVATHTAGHVIAAARRGIENREITLAPWGELNSLQSPPTTEAALNTHLSGIMANAFVCALCAMTLWLAHDWTISDLMNPLGSKYLLQGEDHVVTLRWAFWLNYWLVLANLVPAYPFDMHRMVQAAMHLFAPHLDENITYNACVISGRFFSLLLLVCAAFAVQYPQTDLLPGWFILASLGLVGLFATDVRPLQIPPMAEEVPHVQQVPEEDLEEFFQRKEFKALHPDLLDDGPFAQWLQERRDTARKSRSEQEQNEERRADEILARLHEKGIDSLSEDDHTLLERVSARIRRRLKRSS